eukprot:scaffold4060_cov113-Skeletonema_menzelii.AAC.1
MAAANDAQQTPRRSPRLHNNTPSAAERSPPVPPSVRRSPRIAALNTANNNTASNPGNPVATENADPCGCAAVAAAGNLKYSGVRQKCNPTKKKDIIPRDDLIARQSDYLTKIGELPRCQRMVGNAKGWCNCNCLSIFKDNIEICVAVGRFCLTFGRLISFIRIHKNAEREVGGQTCQVEITTMKSKRQQRELKI